MFVNFYTLNERCFYVIQFNFLIPHQVAFGNPTYVHEAYCMVYADVC